MTITYGAKTRGIANDVRNTHFRANDLVKGEKATLKLINKEFNKTKYDIHLTYYQLFFFFFGKAIHSVLFEVYPELTIFVNYLRAMNKMLKKLNLPTIWLTPAGLIVEQK
jgi:hypothetical protein